MSQIDPEIDISDSILPRFNNSPLFTTEIEEDIVTTIFDEIQEKIKISDSATTGGKANQTRLAIIKKIALKFYEYHKIQYYNK